MDLVTIALWCTILGVPLGLITILVTWTSATRKTADARAEVPRIITTMMNRKALDIPWETERHIVHMWEQHAGTNQQWLMRKSLDGTYSILSRLSGRCLEIEDQLAVNGARARQGEYIAAPHQQWIVTRMPGDVFRIHNWHSGKCLDVLGWNEEDGAAVGQWQCHGERNQQWSIEPPL